MMTQIIGKLQQSILPMEANTMGDNHTITAAATTRRAAPACIIETKNMKTEAITRNIQCMIEDQWTSISEETITEEVVDEAIEANVEVDLSIIINTHRILLGQTAMLELDPLFRWTNRDLCSNIIRITTGIKKEVLFSHNLQEIKIFKVNQSTQFIEGNLAQIITAIQTIMDHRIKIKTKVEESKSHLSHSIRD